MFFNSFTPHDNYSVLNREYLTQPIHMQLSQKEEKFSDFFFKFLKPRLNFEHLGKKG